MSSSSQFKSIASFANAHDAELLSSILRDHGIASFATSGEASVMMPYTTSFARGIQVMVNREDYATARKLLSEIQDTRGDAWFCTACNNDVDAGFDVCWNCGADRTTAAGSRPAKPTSDERASSYDSSAFRLAEVDTKNPYAIPLAPPQRAESEFEPHVDANSADELVGRAWQAAILGLTIFPLVGNAYSMYLLIKSSMLNSTMSDSVRGRYSRTLLLNIISGTMYGVIISALISA